MNKNDETNAKKKMECSDASLGNEEVKSEEKTSETYVADMDKPAIEENTEDLLKKKEEELKDVFDRMQRIAAEYDNFRKRTLKEKERIYTDSLCEIVAKFLPVADNLERAIKAAENDEGQGLKEGISLVYKQLMEVLEKLDVKPIDAVGTSFNPELHDAVMHDEDDTKENNMVVEEFLKGYIYKDEIVIRHSIVKVVN